MSIEDPISFYDESTRISAKLTVLDAVRIVEENYQRQESNKFHPLRDSLLIICALAVAWALVSPRSARSERNIGIGVLHAPIRSQLPPPITPTIGITNISIRNSH